MPIITASQLHNAEVLDTAACRECGHPKADLWHLLWECPQHQIRRQQCLDFINMTPDCMPECLSLHGLPPLLGAQSQGDLWLGPSSQPEHFPDEVRQHFDTASLRAYGTVRLLARIQAGPIPSCEAPQAGPVVGPLPEEPNCYTDGSVFRPTSADWARGGAGLFLSPSLRHSFQCQGSHFAEFISEDLGPCGSTHAPLFGTLVNSTRTEVLALGIALTVPRPLRIASDSKAVVLGFARVLSGLASPESQWGGQHIPRHLIERANCDLWHIISQLLRQRGPDTATVVKVKAHCDSSHIDKGIISKTDLEGNAMADQAAGKASRGQYKALLPHVSGMIVRQAALDRIVAAVISMQVGVMLEASRRLGVFKKVMAKKGAVFVSVSLPTLPPPAHSVALRRHRALGPQIWGAGGSWQHALRAFVLEREWRQAPQGLFHPCPWLLLLHIFQLSTGSIVVPDSALRRGAFRGPCQVKAIVDAFRRAFCCILSEHVHPNDALMFMSCASGQHALMSLAITGFVPGVRMWPCVDTGLLDRAARVLLRMHKRLPPDWEERLGAGTLLLPKAQLLTRVAPWWRSVSQVPAPGVGASPPGTAPFPILCPRQCGATILLPSRPQAVGTRWP